MIFKNLWRRATRSLLTILGISIGVAAVVALGAMARGMAENYTTAIGVSNDLLVVQADAFDAVFSSLDEEYTERIRAVPGVENVDPGIYGWISTDDMPFFLIFGYHADSVAIQHYRVVEGKPITGPKQMIVGRRGADALKLGVEDTLRVYGVPYQIVGIYETGQGMEESGGVVTLEDAQDITQKERKVSLFQVGVSRNTDIDQVITRIESIDKELTASTASDYGASQDWTAYLQGFAWGVAAIAILIGGLGMMSAMVMSVLERTREIGTLRAVGWSRWRVLRMILGEALLLSAVGGVVGILIGMGLAWLTAQAPGLGPMLEGAVTPQIAAQGFFIALFLGLVGGLYPAWTAANLEPVEALRYEGGGGGNTSQGILSRIGNQSFRNLWRRRTRTLLSASAIGIGVATLVMIGGLIDGVIGQLNGLAGSGSPGSITVMQRDVADMSLSSLDERLVNMIQALPEVKSATPSLLGFVMTADLPLFIISGLDPNSSAMAHYKLTEGRYVQRPNEIIVGKVAAENYKLALGGVFSLFDNRYKIVGIYETGAAYEDGGGLLALREAQRLLNRQRSVSFIYVDVYEPNQAEYVQQVINTRFSDARASLSSEFAQNTNDINNAKAMTNAIIGLALIIGGIVVANTMIMSIYERTREIGTLRALGWRRRRILSQIIQESLLLCIVSGVLGSILGVLFLGGVSLIPGANGMISTSWQPSTFILAMGTAIVLGLLGGIYPAWRASKLAPVEALRYE